MKKQLLIGASLLITIASNSQTKFQPTGKIDFAEKMLKKQQFLMRAEPISSQNAVITPSNDESSVSQSANTSQPINTWGVIGGSQNIYGLLVSQQRPLQYNDNLNAVSFIHRKSSSYIASPAPAATAASGVMVAEISTDWGVSWDSTCFWSNNTNWARYPQGAIYNAPATNTSNAMSSAYIVGSGPCTSAALGWVGNWYASKQLGGLNYNNAASTAVGAQQFLTTVPSNTAVGKHSFSRISFSSTDDGKVRSIGAINTDDAGTTFATLGRKGAAVVKGSFNSGVFSWTSDSIICDAAVRTDGGKSMGGQPQMAWNESGTVGYVVFIGSRAGATNSNKGWQPIVYKTTNSGATWAIVNSIDFNSAPMAQIKSRIPAIWSSSLASTPVLPQFNTSEGFGLVVDNSNKLHIISTIVGTAYFSVDSVTGGYSFDSNENYSWGHEPGNRPYVYDFIGDGTAPWTYITVDSLSSEGPGSASGDPGYDENPWDADAGNKVTSDSRIQAGRTPDGKYIIYSWAESDTNFTNNAKKWNSLPNLHVRCLDVTTGSLSATEPIISTTSPGVSSRAMFHYMSSTSGSAAVSSNSINITMPFTVSNSLPYSQLTNNKHWYISSALKFKVPGSGSGNVSILTNGSENASNSIIFPNPAKNNASLLLELNENSSVDLVILNTMGQVLKAMKIQGQIGENNVNLDLNGMSTGIYIVNVKVGNSLSTKKLIIE